MKYDAIVIGAGPAGLIFARYLGEAGFKVAIVEKNNELAVKPCGEGISSRVIETAEISRSEVYRFLSREIKRAYIFAPNGKRLTVEESGRTMGYIIDKRNFLKVLSEYAVSSGVEIYISEPAKNFSRKNNTLNVYTRSHVFKTRLLIGADGYLSVVAKKMGLEKRGERRVIPSIQYVMSNVELDDYEATYFFTGNNVAPLGYAWIFPKDGKIANVGLGVQKVSPRTYLNKFIRDNRKYFSKSQPIEFKGAAVTISGVLEKIVDDNVMLIGEAAGQVIPLTGGGIHTSIAGGKIAAEIAIKALEEDDLSKEKLSMYKRKYDLYWGKRIRDSLKGLKAIEKLSDEELNALAEILSPQDIVNLANGEKISEIAKKILKHPILSIKLARKLLI